MARTSRAGERIEHARRPVGIGPVVERERDLAAGALRTAMHAERRREVSEPRVADPRRGGGETETGDQQAS